MTKIWRHIEGEPPTFIDTFLTPEECREAIDNVEKAMKDKPQKIRFEVEE